MRWLRGLLVLLITAAGALGQPAVMPTTSYGPCRMDGVGCGPWNSTSQTGLGWTWSMPPVLSTVAVTALSTPGAPTVTPTGGAATAWGYKVVARIQNGAYTAAGAEGTTAAGAADLDATHYNTVTWSPITGAYDYAVYRTTVGTTPATTGLIGTTTGLSLVDNGLAGDSATPPATGTTGTIIGGLTGSGAAGRLALWSSASVLTSDAGLTYSGTGTGTVLRIGSTDIGLSRSTVWSAGGTPGIAIGDGTAASESQWIAASAGVFRGAGVSNAHLAAGSVGTRYFAVNTDGSTESVKGIKTTSNGIFAFSASGSDPATPDGAISRVAAGVIGVGTGATGSYAGTMALSGVQGSRTKTVTDATPTDFATFTIADGQMLSGEILYSCKSVKGTDLQVATGGVRFAATREGAVHTTTTNAIGAELLAAVAGTLACTISIAGAAGVVTLTATCDTSQAVPDAMTFQYQINSPDPTLAVTGL